MRKVFSFLAGLVLLIGTTQAQNRTITGKVTDEKGGGVAGVSVTVKGSTTGTTSGADGSYSLSVPTNAKVLVFTSVNFSTEEKNIGTSNTVSVSLTSKEDALSEVVVVGYGVQQKKNFTGSASKVDAKQFANLVTPSVDKQLAGRASGVQVTNSGGLVNSPARIRIRGIQSINQSNDPLIVVDGIPIVSGNLAANTNSNQLGDINPNDIESMEILKDGSATAIFGSRAANGVIMITTKRGDKSGKAKINYDVVMGYSKVLKRFDLLDATQFVAISNEKFINAGNTAKAFMDPNNTNTDWQSIALINSAPIQTHNLSLQGGDKKTTYYLSLNYSKQQGVVYTNNNTSYRVRANIEHEVNKYVKIGNNLTLSRQEDNDQNNGSNSLGGSIAATLRLHPNVSPYSSTTPSGYNIQFPANQMGFGANLQGIDDNWFNIAFTLANNRAYSDKYRIINNTFMEISPLKNLKFRSQASVDFFNDMSFLSYDPRHGDGGGATNGLVDNTNQNIFRYVWQNYINYNINYKKHSVYLTAGHELQSTRTRWTSSTGRNISDIFFVKNNTISGTAVTQEIGGNLTDVGFESLFGRLNYDFAGKYFLQASIRRDGQSSLAPDTRYGTFPGGSIGWRISEEKFWGGLSKVVNNMKIKGSVAKVGNTLGGFPYLSTYGSSPYGNIGGLAANNVGNTGLQWETSTKYDIGTEFSLFNNRITIVADWFLNKIDNLVLRVPTPLSAGVPNNAISQNIGTAENRGIELSLNADIIRGKDFNWSVSTNYSKVENKITSLYSIAGTPVPYIVNGSYNLIRTGDPINILWGWGYAGVNSSNGFPVYTNAAGQFVQQNSTTGAYNILPSKDDPTAGVSSPLTFDDKKNLGVTTPTWFGGFTNFFTYKDFALEVMFRYSGGNSIMNVTRQEALLSNSFHNNGTEILTRWQKAGDVTDVPKIIHGQSNRINQNGNATTRFVESGDYLRLQNVVLSWNYNSKKLEKLTNGYVRSMRFFVQGQNLLVWTKYKGADPDNISTLGIDAGVSPQVRTVSFGLNLGF